MTWKESDFYIFTLFYEKYYYWRYGEIYYKIIICPCYTYCPSKSFAKRLPAHRCFLGRKTLMRCCRFCFCKFPYYVLADIYVNMICCSMIDTHRSIFWSKKERHGKPCSSTNLTYGSFRFPLLIGNMTCSLPVLTSSYVSRTKRFCKRLSFFENIIFWSFVRLLIFYVPSYHEMNRRSKNAYVYSMMNGYSQCSSGSALYLWIMTYSSYVSLVSCHGNFFNTMNSCYTLNHYSL